MNSSLKSLVKVGLPHQKITTTSCSRFLMKSTIKIQDESKVKSNRAQRRARDQFLDCCNYTRPYIGTGDATKTGEFSEKVSGGGGMDGVLG